MRNLILAVLVVLFSQTAVRAGENEALALALADLKTRSFEDRLFTRYIWVVGAEHEDMQAVSLATNYWSRGTVIIRPAPLGKDKLMVMRVDLRSYAPKINDLNEVVKVWEEFQFDPRFNLLLTKDTINFAVGLGVKVPKTKKTVTKTKEKIVDVPPYVHTDGKVYNQKRVQESYQETVEVVIGQGVDVVRVVSEHIDKNLISQLIDLTQSQAPVVSHQYYMSRALSTIQGKGVAQVIYGGLYYQLSGIKKGFKKGTDEDNFLEKLGIGNVNAGIDAKKIFDDLRSDQRVAVFKSGVTAKPRRVDVLKTLAGRDSQGIVSITHDLKEDDIDIGTHPIMNLLDFKDAAREVIFEKQNGLHGFALFNGQGALQDEVPPDVAADHSVPVPQSTRLQPAIGCIRCHAKDSGWRVLTNDVKKLLDSYFDVFGDVTDRKKTIPDVVDRLAGLYAGDLELKILPRARDDYNSAILRATGPWKTSKSQVDIAKFSADRISWNWKVYNYDQIDAAIAIKDLEVDLKQVLTEAEFKASKNPSAEALKRLLPPVAIVIDNFIPEDPRIAALIMGISINRSDWDLVRSFVVTRISKGAKK